MRRPKMGIRTLMIAVVIAALVLSAVVELGRWGRHYMAVKTAQEAARRVESVNHLKQIGLAMHNCYSRLKQIGLAMHNFHDAQGLFPAQAIVDSQGRPLLSWRVTILPYLGQNALYQQFHLDEPWDSPHNKTLISQIPPVYLCPSDPAVGPGNTPYEVVVGPKTIFTGAAEGVSLQDITDGTSNTVLVVEASRGVPWTAPQDLPQSSPRPFSGAGSKHPDGFNTLFADGSVKFLKVSLSPAVFNSLLTRDGGEDITAYSF